MDFLDPKKKRAHVIRLYIGYALLAVAIGIGTLVLLYSSMGYGVDRHTGQVIQNGLVFISSKPGGADIELVDSKGKKQPHSQTDTRLTIPEGQYTATLTKSGYRPWIRTFDLEGGQVERLTYPFLFPENLKTTEVELYGSQPPLVTQSPDRHWTLILKPGSLTEFDTYDANKEDPSPVPVAIPDSLLTAGANQALEVTEWSTNNKHVLLKHTFDNTHEFILFNRDDPGSSLNLNKHFGLNPTEVVLYDKQPEQVYLFTADNGLVQRAGIRDKRMTPQLTNVAAFKSHGSDMVVYVSKENSAQTGKVNVRLRTDDADYVLRELPVAPVYLLDLARYDNRWYVAASAPIENKAYVYQDPLNILSQKNPKVGVFGRTMRLENPQKLAFSANAQFISLQSEKQFTIYDAEEDRQYRYAINKNLDSKFPAKWMDGHRLTAVADGQIVIWDFDGTNLQALSPAVANTYAIFDREYKALYTLAPSTQVKGRFSLTRTPMEL